MLTPKVRLCAQGNVSRHAPPPRTAHPGKLLPSLPFPSVHQSQECLLQKYFMLAGTTRLSLSNPSLECSVFRYGRAVGVKSQNPLELPGALTLLNVASPDCHTHTRGGNGSLQRALDSWGACSRSAGSRGIFGEKLSCIAQWKRARQPWKRRDVGCCVPRVKLGLTSFNNRLHTLRSFFLYHRWNLNSLFTEGLEALVTAAQGLKFHAHHEMESSILTGPWLSFHSSADRRTLGSYWRQSSAWRVTTGWTWLFPITYRGGTLVKFINTGIYGDRTLGENIVRDTN